MHVLIVGAKLGPSSPMLTVLGDAVPALLITCSEQEAQELLGSPEVMLTVHDTKLPVLVTRVLELAPGADDDRRAIEFALHDTLRLAELATYAEFGMPFVIELPEECTLFSRACRSLRQEFQ